MSNEQFKLSDGSADVGGTSLRGEFTCSYKDLSLIFGEPNGGTDEYKVSSAWEFVEVKTGNVFTLYDYKETNMYHPHLRSVKKFRELPSYDWHIGAREGSDIKGFVNWLDNKVSK